MGTEHVVETRSAPGDAISREATDAASAPRGSGGRVRSIIWILLTEIAVAAWYAPAAAQKVSSAPWSVAWPTSERDYRREPISATVETLLRYNEGGAATWRSADDRRWMMYSFRWLPGRTAALFVKNHRPEICLPASGLTMEEASGVHLVTVNGVNLPIRSYRFDDSGRPLHIFYCYWDGRSSYVNDAAAASEDWTARGRLRAAWQGKRELGARMLELAVWGHENDAEARAALERELREDCSSRIDWRHRLFWNAFCVQSLRFRSPETIVVGGFHQRQKSQRHRAR